MQVNGYPGSASQRIISCRIDTIRPLAPIAMPTSAVASAGASLMPSPTMMVGAFGFSASILSTLSAGTASATTSSR